MGMGITSLKTQINSPANQNWMVCFIQGHLSIGSSTWASMCVPTIKYYLLPIPKQSEKWEVADSVPFVWSKCLNVAYVAFQVFKSSYGSDQNIWEFSYSKLSIGSNNLIVTYKNLKNDKLFISSLDKKYCISLTKYVNWCCFLSAWVYFIIQLSCVK